MTEFGDLVAEPAERHLIFGDTRTGKSCHVDWEMRHISATRPDCMQILVDSKPRFRAETERQPFRPKARKSAAWRYEHWAKGPVVPNSVLIDLHGDRPFRGLWEHPGEVAILQADTVDEWRRMLFLLKRFTMAQIGDRERHITADEVLDFYGRNTWGISSKDDVFYHAARAGGERNIGQTLGSQYVFQLPILIRKLYSRITLYHLSEDREMRYLNQIGIPDTESPHGDYICKQWRKQPGGTVTQTFHGRLELPESYLSQLAAS